MANHSIDCPYCGKDQRNFGDRCCDQWFAEQERRATAHRAEQSRRQALFDNFGLSYFYDRSGSCIPHPAEVVALLDRLAIRESDTQSAIRNPQSAIA